MLPYTSHVLDTHGFGKATPVYKIYYIIDCKRKNIRENDIMSFSLYFFNSSFFLY